MKKTLSLASRSLSEQSESKCNGMEREDEIAGLGNIYSTANRNYDSRIARWFSIDPARKKYPNKSTYTSFGNNPIIYIDPGGDDEYHFMQDAQAYADKSTDEQKIPNGRLHHLIPNYDLKIVSDDVSYFYYFKDKKYEVHSPFSIKGGDGNWKKDGTYFGISDVSYMSNLFIQGKGIESYVDNLLVYPYTLLELLPKSMTDGELDFISKLSFFTDGDTRGTLYNIDEVYYNKNEAGNFFYGYATAYLDFSLKTILWGGETYIDYYAGNGRDYDEPWEVTAVIKGYAFFKMNQAAQNGDSESEETVN